MWARAVLFFALLLLGGRAGVPFASVEERVASLRARELRRLALGSCANQHGPQNMFAAIERENPDAFVVRRARSSSCAASVRRVIISLLPHLVSGRHCVSRRQGQLSAGPLSAQHARGDAGKF